jgi:hypothetical protein
MNDYKILKKKLQMVAWIKTTLCSVGNSTARSSLKLAMTQSFSGADGADEERPVHPVPSQLHRRQSADDRGQETPRMLRCFLILPQRMDLEHDECA